MNLIVIIFFISCKHDDDDCDMLVQEKVWFCTSCKIIRMLLFALLDPANHDTKQASKKVYIQMKKIKNKFR
jgi:hypothetical protein